MARDASAFGISTNPKPRARPVSRSVINATESTVPCLENKARTESSVAEKGRLPTYSLVTVITRDGDGETGRRAGRRVEAKVVKPERIEPSTAYTKQNSSAGLSCLTRPGVSP